ncbi:MAG TPA: SMP-30/gluconolactonase/LRE family protein [Anaerolineales bacterium]|nr:SMP-30/gluconolactonase/LRE family protein [Anaerolineales bacterium]
MIFTKGLHSPETPRLFMDESAWLCMEMADRNWVTWISLDGKEHKKIAETKHACGLAVDKNNGIWLCERQQPSLLFATLDGKVECFTTGTAEEPFLFPNDLCFGPDGCIYLTDSGMAMADWESNGKIRPDYKTAQFDGRVFRINPQTRHVTKIDGGIKFTNGIAVGPDGKLYVNEMITGNIYRYDIRNAGRGKREYFGNVMDPDFKGEGFRGPDGMNFGSDGNLYCSVFGQQDVTVLGKDGSVVRRIKTEGRLPTNVAFGPKGEKKLYVSEDQLGQVEVFDVDASAAKLYFG